jgi:hypothetical protein
VEKMNKIIFCDKNKELLEKAKTVFGEVGTIDNIHSELIVDNSGDILKCKKKYPEAKIVTASNPDFSMGGGLDLILKNEYPEQCNGLREFKITKDLFFVISVNKDLKATKKIIRRALLGVYFCSRKNDIILTGLGTGIGGISSEAFLEELALLVGLILDVLILVVLILVVLILVVLILVVLILVVLILVVLILNGLILVELILVVLILVVLILDVLILVMLILNGLILDMLILVVLILDMLILVVLILVGLILVGLILVALILVVHISITKLSPKRVL